MAAGLDPSHHFNAGAYERSLALCPHARLLFSRLLAASDRGIILLSCLALFCSMPAIAHSFSFSKKEPKLITLPKPALDGTLSVEAAMHRRKSARSYATGALTIAEVSQLLWAAQGINRQNGMRTAPSAGALYPLEVYLVAGNVDDLPPGVYHYHPHKHTLELITSGDLRPDLTRAALRQSCIENGAIDLVLAGVYERTSLKYGSRASRYV